MLESCLGTNMGLIDTPFQRWANYCVGFVVLSALVAAVLIAYRYMIH